MNESYPPVGQANAAAAAAAASASAEAFFFCGGVVSHGVYAGEVVEAEANGDGDGSRAVASRRSPKTLLPFSRAGSRTTGFRRHLLSRPTVHAVVGMGSPEAAQREEQ